METGLAAGVLSPGKITAEQGSVPLTGGCPELEVEEPPILQSLHSDHVAGKAHQVFLAV